MWERTTESSYALRRIVLAVAVKASHHNLKVSSQEVRLHRAMLRLRMLRRVILLRQLVEFRLLRRRMPTLHRRLPDKKALALPAKLFCASTRLRSLPRMAGLLP